VNTCGGRTPDCEWRHLLVSDEDKAREGATRVRTAGDEDARASCVGVGAAGTGVMTESRQHQLWRRLVQGLRRLWLDVTVNEVARMGDVFDARYLIQPLAVNNNQLT
jgi:hypothetical protein